MKAVPFVFGGFVLAWGATAALAQTAATPPSTTAAPATSTIDPAASATMTTLQKVCLPLLSGAKPASVAQAAGVKIQDEAWTIPIQGKQRIDVELPDGSNPHLCSATITYSGGGAAILGAINAWARSQTPPLAPVKINEKVAGTTHLRTTSTWEASSPKGSEAIVLSQEKTLQGQPVAGDLDQAELLVSLTPS